MKKALPIILVAIGVIILAMVFRGTKVDRVINWEETFNEKSNDPYGVSVLYRELPRLFEGQQFRTVYHTPYSYLNANSEGGYGDHVAEGNFIIIGNSDYLDYESVDELLYFVDEGNTLFISDYWFLERIQDTLDIEVDYIEELKDSTYQLSFEAKNLRAFDTDIDKSAEYAYFSSYPEEDLNILGYASRSENRPNFIDVPFGNGNIILHLEPKIFTNYNVLKGTNYKYVELNHGAEDSWSALLTRLHF